MASESIELPHFSVSPSADMVILHMTLEQAKALSALAMQAVDEHLEQGGFLVSPSQAALPAICLSAAVQYAEKVHAEFEKYVP